MSRRCGLSVVIVDFNGAFNLNRIRTDSCNITGLRHNEFSLWIIMDRPIWYSRYRNCLIIATFIRVIREFISALCDWIIWNPVNYVLHRSRCLVIVDRARIDGQNELLLYWRYDPAVGIRVPMRRFINVLVHDQCYWILANVGTGASCESSSIRVNITVLILAIASLAKWEEVVFRVVSDGISATVLEVDILHVIFLVL